MKSVRAQASYARAHRALWLAASGARTPARCLLFPSCIGPGQNTTQRYARMRANSIKAVGPLPKCLVPITVGHISHGFRDRGDSGGC